MWIAISALNLAFAVMLGAFGAHALKDAVHPEQLLWWNTATDYFFYHALGLLILATFHSKHLTFSIKLPFLFIQFGILLFCGSLYAITLGLPKSFAFITPIGGTLMICGWIALAWRAFKSAK